jgi:hypothetical protein
MVKLGRERRELIKGAMERPSCTASDPFCIKEE